MPLTRACHARHPFAVGLLPGSASRRDSCERKARVGPAYYSAENVAARKAAQEKATLWANMSEEEREAAVKAAEKAAVDKAYETEHDSGDEDSIAADDIEDPTLRLFGLSPSPDPEYDQRWQGEYMVDSEEEELDEDNEREGEKKAAQDPKTTSAGYHALMRQMETNRRIYYDKKHQADWTDADFKRRGLLADEKDKGGIFETTVVDMSPDLIIGGNRRLTWMAEHQGSEPRWKDVYRNIYERFTYVKYKRTKEGFVLRDEDGNPVIEPAREGIVLVKYIKTLPQMPLSLNTMATDTHI